MGLKEFNSIMQKNQHLEAIRKLEEIYDLSFGYLYTQGFIFCGNKNLTKDSIQELFLELCEKPHLILNIENPQAYLLISLKRKILRTKKKNDLSTTQPSLSTPAEQLSYEELLIKSEEDKNLQLNIQKALASLSATQRKVLKLRFFEGLSYEEIANVTNTSKRTVYNQIHEAIKRIRKYVLLSLIHI